MTDWRLRKPALASGLLLAGALAWSGAAPAAAQQAEGALAVELNKLEDQDGACRAYLVLENRSGGAFETLTLDLVIFDPEGAITKRLAVEAAPLPADKTRVKLFDIQGVACGGIGRILFNGVLACTGEAYSGEQACAAAIEPRSRLDVAFEK